MVNYKLVRMWENWIIHVAGGNVKWNSYSGKQYGNSLKKQKHKLFLKKEEEISRLAVAS